jgi:hypothetical protein
LTIGSIGQVIGYTHPKPKPLMYGCAGALMDCLILIDTMTPDPFWPFPTALLPLTPSAPPVRANPNPKPHEESPL